MQVLNLETGSNSPVKIVVCDLRNITICSTPAEMWSRKCKYWGGGSITSGSLQETNL